MIMRLRCTDRDLQRVGDLGMCESFGCKQQEYRSLQGRKRCDFTLQSVAKNNVDIGALWIGWVHVLR